MKVLFKILCASNTLLKIIVLEIKKIKMKQNFNVLVGFCFLLLVHLFICKSKDIVFFNINFLTTNEYVTKAQSVLGV